MPDSQLPCKNPYLSWCNITNMKRRSILIALILLIFMNATIHAEETSMLPETATSTSHMTLSIANGSITNGSFIETRYTCSGMQKSPDIRWNNIPNNTQSLAFILDDPDAPAGTFTHWIVYNIPPEITNIPENAAISQNNSQITIGINTAKEKNYFPPCPPHIKYIITDSHSMHLTLLSLKTIWIEMKLTRSL
jgi:Raf kinase inhibitor-like YbhB/YbcL family protein